MRPTYGCSENFRVSLTMPTATFPKIFHGPLFWFTLWMCLQNLKSVAFRGVATGVDIGIYTPPPKSAKVNFLWGKNDVRTAIQQFYPPPKTFIPPKQISGYAPGSFTRSWDNRGYPKNLGSAWICPRSIFSKILMGFHSDWGFGLAL